MKLGFRAVLSNPSKEDTYEAGIESIPSENACYPAKLSHGHIMNLLEKDVDFIWMPCVKWERQEDMTAGNHFNCPIVASYPEALRLNIDAVHDSEGCFLNPWPPYYDKEKLKGRLYFELCENHADLLRKHGQLPTRAEIDAAVEAAWEEDESFKRDMRRAGVETLAWMEQAHTHGIVLAGRPYHNNPEINHAIPELSNSFGLAVLTEDSIAHLAELERPIRAVEQWMYHTRLYASVKVATQCHDLDLIQLSSFGCGLDAVTTDQVQEILEAAGKVYTVLKIDEVSNLGVARIRVRSLLAALKDHSRKGAVGSKIALDVIRRFRKPVFQALDASERFHSPADIFTVVGYAEQVLSLCNSMGEGWLLTGEMIELIHDGAPNIVCTQPFTCLSNHVVGKATIEELRRQYPQNNIVAVDYDLGASEVNRLNRIKLMISVAKANLADKNAVGKADERAGGKDVTSQKEQSAGA